ncbi:MAG: hypothetical protein QOH25_2547 [Acidobacteriota bacterium]|nr:hypothetical protein [Acidobacteriota bacterium]
MSRHLCRCKIEQLPDFTSIPLFIGSIPLVTSNDELKSSYFNFRVPRASLIVRLCLSRCRFPSTLQPGGDEHGKSDHND